MNGGRDHRTGTVGGSGALDASLEDRYQRVLSENHQLKLQRNDLQEKVKDLTTKFRKLIRDLKLGSDVEAALMTTPGGMPSPRSAKAPLQDISPQNNSHHVSPQRTVTTTEGGTSILVQQLMKERDALRDQILSLQRHIASVSASQPGGGSSPQGPQTLDERVKLQQLEVTAQFDKQRIEQLQGELQRLQTMLQQEMHQRMMLQQQVGGGGGGEQHHGTGGGASRGTTSKATAAHNEEQLRHLRVQVQQHQHEAQQYRSNIEHLTRERDTLQMQLRLTAEVHGQENSTLQQGFVDPMSLLELQHDIQNKVSQITVLSNRLTYAQSQLGTFKQECERLINELRLQHNQMAEVKKQLFEQEHEKSSLALKCERLSEVELSLQHKQEELLKAEQQLLRMVEKLQTVGRETEMAVRRELAQRLAEAEQSRDEADRNRRAKEQSLYDAEQSALELRRKVEVLQEALNQAKKDLAKEIEEKKELASRNALLSGVSGDLGEDVHKAVALATMRQRLERQLPHHTPGGANPTTTATDSNKILSMWDEGLEWNEGWEASKLRESMATATLDLELADTRIQQLTAHLNDCEQMLSGVSRERDTLLDENATLRRRISGVQTSLAKRQLARYRQQMRQKPNCGVLSIRLRTLTPCSGGDIPPVEGGGAFFFTLDHVLPSYDTLVSTMFYSLDEPSLLVEFRFTDVNLDEATLSSLRNATFDLQLHRCGPDNSNEIIGYAEWPASRLLECDGGCIFDAALELVSPGSGAPIATCSMDVESEHVVLPVLLGAPLSSIVLDPSRTTALLYALRAVVGIHVQIMSVSKLPLSVVAPYVFYTCSIVDGTSPVSDTTLEPMAGARIALQQHRTRIMQQQTVLDNGPSASNLMHTLPAFSLEHDPRTHKIVLDRHNIHSVAEGVLLICVFDRAATEVEHHVGVVQVPLRPLLDGPGSSIMKSETLSPAGEIEFGISWVLSASAET